MVPLILLSSNVMQFSFRVNAKINNCCFPYYMIEYFH